MRARKAISFALLLVLAGCDAISAPPRWREVCESGEGGSRYYSRPPAGPLAMPGANDPEIGLMLIRASAVEIFSYATDESARLYTEGEGRYLVSLAEPRTEACNQALINRGYDPATLAFNPDSPDALFTYDLDACFTAERIGPMQDYYNPDEITLTSRYIVRAESVIDPRGEPDHPIGRTAYQIFDRETNQVIAERIIFSSNAGHYSIECPKMSRRWLHVYPWDVFAPRE